MQLDWEPILTVKTEEFKPESSSLPLSLLLAKAEKGEKAKAPPATDALVRNDLRLTHGMSFISVEASEFCIVTFMSYSSY